MKRTSFVYWWRRFTIASFLAIPAGTVAAIWIPSLWRIPLTAVVLFVFLFLIGMVCEFARQLDEQQKRK